jgi:hypothetical protein
MHSAKESIKVNLLIGTGSSISRYGRILDRIKAHADTNQQDKALKILEWLVFAFRPLKYYEVTDGIVFKIGSDVIDESTKLRKGILDVCRPLIEERTDNIVDLVHFSAKESVIHDFTTEISFLVMIVSRYLLHPLSGPQLSPFSAHRDIVFSCLAYLSTCSIFLGNSSRDHLNRVVVKGYHNLYGYVHEFWIPHLLAYIELWEVNGSSLEEWDEVDKRLQALYHFERLAMSGHNLKFASVEEAPPLEPTSRTLAGITRNKPNLDIELERLPQFVRRAIAFRKKSPRILAPSGGTGGKLSSIIGTKELKQIDMY